ncbi:MAG: shikimate dehydrogenase [Vulcanimicrobiota bacterium]
MWLLGDPVSHSLSPLIQNTALALLGETVVYLAARVTARDFSKVVQSLVALGALGANITVPHKLRAFELCDRHSPRATLMQAVNTLHFREGEIYGDNTDGVGWWNALTREFPVEFQRAVVLGAGGASRAVCHTLMANGVEELVLLNRTPEKARRLKDELPSPERVRIDSLSRFSSYLQDNTLVVQTTSVGLKGQESPVPLPQGWPDGCVLSELIYGRPTELLKRVRSLDGLAQDGLGMLCGQAAESLAIWTGRPVTEIPLEKMIEAARKKLS